MLRGLVIKHTPPYLPFDTTTDPGMMQLMVPWRTSVDLNQTENWDSGLMFDVFQ